MERMLKWVALVALAVPACECNKVDTEEPETWSIGGTVSGLLGAGLTLQNNGADDLSITDDGEFTFATELEEGEDYEVTLTAQPTDPSQTCALTNASGTVPDGPVTDVTVTCTTDTFTVGGSTTNLVGSGLVLQNNKADDLEVKADGPFTFATPLDDGSTYAVTVLTQPATPQQECTVTDGTGTLESADVDDVAVDCVTYYTVGGTVSGLLGPALTLQNNGGDDLAITGDGAFTFTTPVLDGNPYAVTISAQPHSLGQECSVTDGSGKIDGANITDVVVDCSCRAVAEGILSLDDVKPHLTVTDSNWAIVGAGSWDDHSKYGADMETLYAMCGDVAHKIAAHGDPAPDIPKASFYGFGPMADINESGVFVYQAELEGIDGVGYEEPAALYWGTLDDPRQLIVKTGDVLNGYTVQNISFKPFINDDGVISFKTESDIRLQPEKYDYTDYVHQVHRYDTTTGTLETLISIGDAVDGEIIYELSDGPIDEDGNVLVKAEELDGIYENDAILLVSAPGTWDVITRTGMVGPSKRPYTHVGQPTFNTAGVVLYTAEECLDGSTSCYGTDEITHLTRRLPDDSHEVLLTTRSAMGSVGTTPAYVEGFTHLQASVGEAGYQAWKIDLTDSADDYGTELGYALLLYDGTDLDEVARTPLVVGKDTLYDFSYVHAGSDGTVFFHAQYEEDGETNGLYCWDEAGGVREVARDGGTVDSTTIEWLHASAIAFDRQIRADGTILTVAELDGYTDWYSFYDEEPPEQLIVLECPDAS